MTEIDLPTLIRELGLDASKDHVAQLEQYCLGKVASWVRQHGGVQSLDELLRLACNYASVHVEVIENDDDPAKIAARYFDKGDPALVQVETHDWSNTYGLCFLRHNRQPWERWFVAVVDGRGKKVHRVYFSKWHEIVHALSWPRQLRFAYRQNLIDDKPPLEQAVDKIAAQLAFYPPILEPAYAEHIAASGGRACFELLDAIKRDVTPDASLQSLAIDCLKYTPLPTLFVVARMALKPTERRRLAQAQRLLFDEHADPPTERLRVAPVVSNEPARHAGLFIPEHFQVPEQSIINHAHDCDLPGVIVAAEEDLSWWESGGQARPAMPIHVEARCSGQAVYAFVTATGDDLQSRQNHRSRRAS